MTTEPRQLDPDIIERLRDLGIDNPNPDDPLHKKLVQTMYRTRALPVGQQIVAVKFDINSELRDAGARFAKAKTDYDHYIDKEATRIRLAEGEKSGEMAIRRANASDEAYRLLLTYRLAEQQERRCGSTWTRSTTRSRSGGRSAPTSARPTR